MRTYLLDWWRNRCTPVGMIDSCETYLKFECHSETRHRYRKRRPRFRYSTFQLRIAVDKNHIITFKYAWTVRDKSKIFHERRRVNYCPLRWNANNYYYYNTGTGPMCTWPTATGRLSPAVLTHCDDGVNRLPWNNNGFVYFVWCSRVHPFYLFDRIFFDRDISAHAAVPVHRIVLSTVQVYSSNKINPTYPYNHTLIQLFQFDSIGCCTFPVQNDREKI